MSPPPAENRPAKAPGYQLKYEYGSNTVSDISAVAPTRVRAINNATEYCSPTADSCSVSTSWPTIEVGYELVNANWFQVNVARPDDPNSYVTVFGFTVQHPSGQPDRAVLTNKQFLTIAYDSSDRVESVTRDTDEWTYAYSDSGANRTTTITDPKAQTRTIVSIIASGLVSTDTDDLGHETAYTYDGYHRLTEVEAELGNHTTYTYDLRGNVLTTTLVPKPSSGLSNIGTSASYDSTCSNVVTCNKPNYTTDAQGKVTDYTYDSTHGGLLTVTAPAPGSGAVRPQTRIAYTQLYAYYKNSGGSIAQAATSIYMPTTTSACATTSSCSGGADEVKSTTTYGSTGVANNLLPTIVSVGAGDNSLIATTTTTYNAFGQTLTVDGPLSGSTDTVNYIYDWAHRLSQIITPDPDGGGSLKYRFVRYTYNDVDQVTMTEMGGVTSVSGGTFTVLHSSQTHYDAQFRPFLMQSDTGPVVQYGYDSVGRLECTAARGNSSLSIWGGDYDSIAACDLGPEGVDGPDRITKNIYDDAGRITEVKVALHTAKEASIKREYNDNNQVTSLTNERNYKTKYYYDGFDRLIKTEYPDPSTTNTSSSSDYESITYSASGQVSQTRKRDGGTFTPTYDDLGRVTHMNAPGTSDDADYTYDNFGRTLSIATGQTLSFTYDALGRAKTAVGPLGTVSYDYDLAGRRTKMTWPDTFYVNYDYDDAGDLTKIRENGATSGIGVLATYAYDDLGRRGTLTRGNGVVTTYSVNANSQLTGLAQNLTGSTDDNTISLTFGGFGGIRSRANSNAAYDPAMPSSATLDYTNSGANPSNGLNQYTRIGGVSPTHDSSGNMTSDGTHSYTFDSLDRLSGAGGASLSYDPLGRLYETVASSVTTHLQYDGQDLIGEYNSSGTLQRRYVHGPGTDEALVWYEGSGTSDRRWLIADERGSIVAVTDASGAAIAKNSYDEYGKPGSSNVGRFQYTGQTWLAEVGLYYYKARFYSASLGRFIRPDPIGYQGGLNVYSYADNDAINATDPKGMDGSYCSVTGTNIGWIPDGEGGRCENGIMADTIWVAQGEEQSSSSGGSRGGGGSAARWWRSDDHFYLATKWERPAKPEKGGGFFTPGMIGGFVGGILGGLAGPEAIPFGAELGGWIGENLFNDIDQAFRDVPYETYNGLNELGRDPSYGGALYPPMPASPPPGQ